MANSNIRNNTPVVTTGAGTVKWFNAAKGLGFVTSAADPHKRIMVPVKAAGRIVDDVNARPRTRGGKC